MSRQIPMPGFFVWNPEAGHPQSRHPSFDSAKKEAERLADKNRNQCFFVLVPIGCFVNPTPGPQWRDTDAADLIFPF